MNDERFKFTRMFMAKADNERRFYGTIKDGDKNTLHSKILVKNDVHNGYIYAEGIDKIELGKKLDELVVLILDCRLHTPKGKKITLCGIETSLN